MILPNSAKSTPDLSIGDGLAFFLISINRAMEQPIKIAKPFLEYDALVRLLIQRGMIIRDPLRAQRKLTQVGYYRLSGYWHTSQKYSFPAPKTKQIFSEFQNNTTFDSVFNFYLFDKSLRLELTCALERIEIYLRTIIAHELGRIDPMAHKDKKNFSKFSTSPAHSGQDGVSDFDIWHSKHEDLLSSSREESILSHRTNQKPIPLWVASEAWSFGTLSKLYSMLNGANQQRICDRLGLENRVVLDNWLINFTGIRNRCAHHSRLCNRPNIRTLIIPKNGYFNLINLSEAEKNKLYGFICVIWFLVKKIGPSSSWINRIADIIDSKPHVNGFNFKSMGFGETGFPRKLFPQTIPNIIHAPGVDELFSSSTTTIKATLAGLKNISDQQEQMEQSKRYIDQLMEFAADLEQSLP
jgi:abortive infection bacteriophage resistance protein